MKLVSSFACASLYLIFADVLYYSLFKFITIAKAHGTLYVFTFVTIFFVKDKTLSHE
jgi:hypothetical protein